MARCARSPELRGDSDRLGVARVRTRATTPGLSPPCWFRARAIDEQRSVARPSGCWWLAACDIHMLPLTSKIKGETRTPIFYHSLKLEITFCVQGVIALLLTDVFMPIMDGYQLATAIRQEEAGARRIPIVALSANAVRGEADKARALGVDVYLTKPTLLK